MEKLTKSFYQIRSSGLLIEDTRGQLFLRISTTSSQVVHEVVVHQPEGVLVRARATHHRRHLQANLDLSRSHSNDVTKLIQFISSFFVSFCKGDRSQMTQFLQCFWTNSSLLMLFVILALDNDSVTSNLTVFLFSKAVVLNHGVATHLCVASFIWCVAK